MLLHAQRERQQLLHVVLDPLRSIFIQLFVLEHPGRIQPKIHPNLPILLETASIKLRTKPCDLHPPRLQPPRRVQATALSIRKPKHPDHLELIRHIVMHLLGSLGNGALDDGALSVGRGLRPIVIHIDPLIGRRLGPVNRVNASRRHAAKRTVRLAILRDHGKLPQHAHQRRGQRLQAEVRVPQTEIKLIGHPSILSIRSSYRQRNRNRAMRR